MNMAKKEAKEKPKIADVVQTSVEEKIDFNAIEKKWQAAWEKEKIFEVNFDKSKQKYFINFPYPYINAYLHLGHAFSSVRVDVMARYKRMNGFNVLFPQGWHCTGTPVWAASQRIKENEEKQIQIMKLMGFSDKEIPKFSEVKHWIDTFVPAAQEDFIRIGNSVDWRRSFITTDLNPHYDKFIRWQFTKLKELGLIIKGKYPVVWCPKDNMAVGDHDRVEGEGENAQEYCLLKFKFGNSYLIAATLRPETVFGETNFWVNPNVNYVEAKVGKEIWIVSKPCIEKLKNQDREIKIISEISGKNLIGKTCKAPLIDRDLLILPAPFSDPNIGAGLVTSVPSDAPYDYIALRDLQENEKEMKKYGLNSEKVRAIKPISIIDSKEWGDMPAVKIVSDMKIQNQNDPKLEEATQIIYKAGFYSGKMNSNCGKYSGMNVTEAKEKMKQEMIEKNLLEIFYELSGKVVCRCLTPSVIKIVSDQWFMNYGNKDWKLKAHKALDAMKLYPEIIRPQFNYVLDWLREWACTHHHGTGTKLPWDEHWVIESLSDSTIYMAYYTIAHLIKDYPSKKIDDKFFDYVFLGKGEGDKDMKKMKEEFEYWYPFDVRSTAKDLVQNHMSFCIFNHAAIFPEKHWPKGFAVNGWLLVNGEKMSKSKGNFYTIRQMLEKYPSDIIRANLIFGGEGLDDPNFDFKNADSIKNKIEQFYEFVLSNYKPSKLKVEFSSSDKLFLHYVNKFLKDGKRAMEEMMFRSAFDKLFYQMQRILREYTNRGEVNQQLINDFIINQINVLSPFCPHIAEELWHKIGNKSFVSLEAWPVADESKIDDKLEEAEKNADKTVSDILNVLNIIKQKSGKEGTRVYLYVMPFELASYNAEEISRRIMKEVKVFAVNDKAKYDPEGKASKAKPGKPAIFIE
jgi:leucyl-tRNA synthetase